jgi:hypothetical protein
MAAPVPDFLEAIAEHSAGFAAAADGNLDSDVEHARVGPEPTLSGI